MNMPLSIEKISDLLRADFRVLQSERESSVTFQGLSGSLRSFLRKLEALSESELPHLYGLFAEKTGGKQVITLILGADQMQSAVVIAEFSESETLPSLTGLWKFAQWWEQECEMFHGVHFDQEKKMEGASWQLS